MKLSRSRNDDLNAVALGGGFHPLRYGKDWHPWSQIKAPIEVVATKRLAIRLRQFASLPDGAPGKDWLRADIVGLTANLLRRATQRPKQ